jgi:hypothetical protein
MSFPTIYDGLREMVSMEKSVESAIRGAVWREIVMPLGEGIISGEFEHLSHRLPSGFLIPLNFTKIIFQMASDRIWSMFSPIQLQHTVVI